MKSPTTRTDDSHAAPTNLDSLSRDSTSQASIPIKLNKPQKPVK